MSYPRTSVRACKFAFAPSTSVSFNDSRGHCACARLPRAASWHAASLTREDVRALIGRGRPLIAGAGERFEVIPLGGKGL